MSAKQMPVRSDERTGLGTRKLGTATGATRGLLLRLDAYAYFVWGNAASGVRLFPPAYVQNMPTDLGVRWAEP